MADDKDQQFTRIWNEENKPNRAKFRNLMKTKLDGVLAEVATAAVPAEGPDLDLPLSAAAALPSLAAVATASVARLALVLDRADVERRVDVLNQLLRLRHRAVLPDVQPDVAAHKGDVAVVDEERLVLVDLPDLVVPQGQEDGPGLVAYRRFDELSRFAELRRDLSLFTQTDDLDQDIHFLGP